jgi:transposase InsO family protein
MSDHLNQREENQGEGAPEGAPLLAPLAPAGLARPASESSPSLAEPEAEGPADPSDDPGLAEPFAEAVGPPRLRPMRKGQRLVRKPASPKLQIGPEHRLLILDTWRRSGLPAADFSTIVGIAKHTLYTWKKRFEQEGPAGLMDRPRGGRKGSKLPELTKRTILMLKESNPDWGCQRISDMLVRGPALPASPTAVARVLKEAGYELEEVPTRRHPDKVRRFERARANQLWQTDLFTFVLKRQNRRVYLVAFMDDHSRFVTGFGLHASQSTALVLEVLRTAITSYGAPEEILTDNGTQYVTWRGKSAFTKELEKRGIRQVVASPRRPQTLGKIERFWGTLWRECIETAVFLDLADAQRRIGHFIDHYNFQRTHQGIDGLVPADRYFGAGSGVLETLKKRVAANALELARHGVPKKPFYLTGQVGDKSFSVHAEGERVILKRQGEERQEVDLVSPQQEASAESASPQALPEPVCPNGSPVAVPNEPSAASVESPGSSPLDQILPQLDEAFSRESDRDGQGGAR